MFNRVLWYMFVKGEEEGMLIIRKVKGGFFVMFFIDFDNVFIS